MMIYEKVKEILLKELSLTEEELTLEKTFEELGIDSLDLVELVMEIEEAFDITIEEAEGLHSVADLVRYIDEATKA